MPLTARGHRPSASAAKHNNEIDTALADLRTVQNSKNNEMESVVNQLRTTLQKQNDANREECIQYEARIKDPQSRPRLALRKTQR